MHCFYEHLNGKHLLCVWYRMQVLHPALYATFYTNLFCYFSIDSSIQTHTPTPHISILIFIYFSPQVQALLPLHGRISKSPKDTGPTGTCTCSSFSSWSSVGFRFWFGVGNLMVGVMLVLVMLCWALLLLLYFCFSVRPGIVFMLPCDVYTMSWLCFLGGDAPLLEAMLVSYALLCRVGCVMFVCDVVPCQTMFYSPPQPRYVLQSEVYHCFRIHSIVGCVTTHPHPLPPQSIHFSNKQDWTRGISRKEGRGGERREAIERLCLYITDYYRARLYPRLGFLGGIFPWGLDPGAGKRTRGGADLDLKRETAKRERETKLRCFL